MKHAFGHAIVLVLCLCFCLTTQATFANQSDFTIETFAEGLDHPWSLAFLPNGDLLVSERAGRLRRITSTGELLKPIENLPKIFVQGQGGLLGLAIDPDYSNNQRVYFSFSEAKGDVSGIAVARGKLENGTLKNVQVIYRQKPKVSGDKHFGSRLVFAKDGSLFITLGERFHQMEESQKLDNHMGKIIRILPDGSLPNDNPFANAKGALPDIWSYGHRNVQGAALHPLTGKLWVHEHGPRGGDEINIPMPGKNYGWPEASYGNHYWLIPIKDDHKQQGFEEPIYHWTPSIAPSGMVFYTAGSFPDWKGDLFVGALAGRHLARLELDGKKVVREHQLLVSEGYRVRDVAQGPDGMLYLVTDSSNGKVLRLVPKP